MKQKALKMILPTTNIENLYGNTIIVKFNKSIEALRKKYNLPTLSDSELGGIFYSYSDDSICISVAIGSIAKEVEVSKKDIDSACILWGIVKTYIWISDKYLKDNNLKIRY